jgi:pyruvate kinase
MFRRTKIIATIGPASESEAMLEKLILAGVNVARLNFSHGTHEQHAARLATIRQVAQKLDMPVGILQDLQGPKIRVGTLSQPLQLADGELVCLYAAEDTPPTVPVKTIPVDFPELFDSVHPDDRLLLDDGRLAFAVTSCGGRTLTARVVVGGTLTSHKGINLPGVRIRVPGFTEKDQADLIFGMKQGVDAVAISFVRTVEDVLQVRQAMEKLAEGKPLPLLIAKLERPEALENLDAILDAVDGVMVARGDLGVEMPPERVPVLQKHIIQAANAHAKLVITATQMLESMIHNPLPTRAEATDVANAVFDGTDAVMLSAETASGEYPLQAVQMMDRIVREAEKHFVEWGKALTDVALGESDAASMARAAAELAYDRDVSAVAVFTMQGRTAWLMSKARPRAPILAFTPEQNTYRRLAFLWGTQPRLVPFASTLEEMLAHVDQALLKNGLVQPGQQVVLVCGFPVGAMRPPNMALLHTVGA